MRLPLLLCALLAFLSSCAQPSSPKSDYPDNIGDIAFDPNVDDPGFKLCNEQQVYQYYNFGKGVQYEGEKPALEAHFRNELKEKTQQHDTGFITIRFIVNCEGKTGRFRTQQMTNDYTPMNFDNDLPQQLLALTKQLNRWKIGGDEKTHVDYYQYLTFKIENGKLKEIMP